MNIRLRDETISILQCYAPQVGCPDSDKIEFESLIENNLRGNCNIIIGDMNAQVGSNRENYETVMGPWGYGSQNPEGERLLDFCVRNEMILGNTWFKKRDSHKITRYSWNGIYKTLIDYSIISDNIKSWLYDVKVIPSVSLDSDHRLLVTSLKIKKLKTIILAQERKIRSYKLKDPKLAE